ncbi:uncharacterized protein N7477_008718 [Penicillium maclennaniae]|uniref:uncharacterized protein n=1 Tax=Penicillium maclennaniae TaxID=1343394 RepID=UPI002541A8E5|nr:uncharacterized protein N7477_008718 [Penicillium maclennaniae]KAJ5666270.1 hypothetical protein N7477_008718 [Penicillium maclennaniae]
MGSPRSDDGGERPVRKQLSKATIGSTPQDPTKENISGRKRSFEESRDVEETHTEGGQVRKKRSRECTPNSPEQKQAGSRDESARPQEVGNPIPSISSTVSLELEEQKGFAHPKKSPGPHQANELPEMRRSLVSEGPEERERLFGRL